MKTLRLNEQNKPDDYWDALVNLMDDDLREQVHRELAPCTNAEFLRRYAELHKKKYNEDFPPEQI